MVLINLLNNKEQFKFKRFIVNDINSNIIDFYILLKENYNYIKNNLKIIEKSYNSFANMDEKEKYYYEIREKFNKTNSKKRTVYFLFLMKAGFNGVYRENKDGKFNVPFGKKQCIRIDYNNLKRISNLIENVEFYNLDYKEFFKKLKSEKILNRAFLYCDPPYLPEDGIINQKQLLYTKEIFKHEEFVNDMSSLKTTTFMISMSDSVLANIIYSRFESCQAKELIRTINPKKSFKSKELIFSNYKIEKK